MNTTLFALWVCNANSGNVGSYLVNDEELSHTESKTDSQFTMEEVLAAVVLIHGYGDARTEYRIEPHVTPL